MKSLIPMLREIPASLPATSPAAGHMAPQPVFPGSWHTQCAVKLPSNAVPSFYGGSRPSPVLS